MGIRRNFNALVNRNANRIPGVCAEMEHLKHSMEAAGGRVVECLTGTDGVRCLAAADFLLTMPSGDIATGYAGRNGGLCETMVSALEDAGFDVACVTGFSRAAEKEGLFISGASGMIADMSNGVVYFCPSRLNNEDLMIELADDFCLQPVILPCVENVERISQVLHLGRGFALAALGSIKDGEGKDELLEILYESGRMVVKVTEEQASRGVCEVFSGTGDGGRQYTFMAAHAADGLSERQAAEIREFTAVVKIPFQKTFAAAGRGTGAFVLPVNLPFASGPPTRMHGGIISEADI